MSSGVGPVELILLVVIGLLVLGPEKLPRVASQIGRWVGKARRTANQLRYQIEREVALADIEKASGKPAGTASKRADSDDAGDDTATEPSAEVPPGQSDDGVGDPEAAAPEGSESIAGSSGDAGDSTRQA